MKRHRWTEKQHFTVAHQLAVYCTAEEHREIVRRIAASPENHELCITESLVKMTDWQCEKTATRHAEAARAAALAAIRICDEVEAESRKRDEEAEGGVA